jgi:conjugal transfer pilus assembly protein TraW
MRSAPNNSHWLNRVLAPAALGVVWLVAGAAHAQGMSLARPRVTLGETFPIAEPDTMTELRAAAGRVDWRAWMGKSPDQYGAFKSSALPRAVKTASRLFDPTYTAPEDIRDEKGRVLIPRGARANALDRIKLPGRYIVIEPTASHYRWLDEVARPAAGDKVLLANGNVLVQRQKTRRPLYLLDARFIERFGLRVVPSIVVQEGNRLRVSEYAIAR